MKRAVQILSFVAGSAAIALLALAGRTDADLSAAGAEMAKAADAFLAGLTPEQKAKACFELGDAERLNWHFIPRPRKGLPIKEMNEAQRKAAHALLAAGLSQSGYKKAETIMSLETIIKELEGPNGKMVRDPELYYFSVFGKPGPTWAWRMEGHHLSFNFTVVNGKFIAAGPAFMGSNPGEVKSGPHTGLRVLGADEDLGRELAKSLDADQAKAGILPGAAPADILFVPGKKPGPLEPAGVAWAQLKPAQQALVWKIVEEYAKRLRGDIAARDLAAIKKETLVFAWAGPLERHQGHYYRIQGPHFTIEYDNTQGNGNHVHSVWHDHADNFGESLLKTHYKEEHK
ncbi:MAG TPA: DUF3500 domain-containing protein [Planctomycetota bacterium]